MFGRKRRLHRKLMEQIKISMRSVSEHTIIRNILYDSQVPDPELVAKYLGLTPLSDEVSDREYDESMNRLGKFIQIFNLIDSHATLVARIMTASYLTSLSEEDSEKMTEEALQAMEITFATVSRASIVSCLTTMEDIGIIHRGYINHE